MSRVGFKVTVYIIDPPLLYEPTLSAIETNYYQVNNNTVETAGWIAREPIRNTRSLSEEPGTYYLTKGWVEAADSTYAEFLRLKG